MDIISHNKQMERERRMKEMFNNVFIMHRGIEILAIAYMATGLFVFVIFIIYFSSKVTESREMEKAYKKYTEERKNEKNK